MVVVVCKFCSVEEVCPVVLLMITEYPDVCFDPFVVVFNLSL